MVSEGEKVPEFEAQDENGTIVSDQNLLGSHYILFFYPKDDSPGCTKEACSVRDNYKAISKYGYKIFGISPDNMKKHRKFIDKYEFQYNLLADPEKEIIKSFGLWGPKKFMGREITGVYRKSLIIDDKGIILKIIEKVKTKEHGSQLLSELKLLHNS